MHTFHLPSLYSSSINLLPADALGPLHRLLILLVPSTTGVNFYQTFDYVRSFTPKPVSAIEAIVSSLSKNAVDMRPGMLIVFSENGKTARLIAKYRPCAPVLLVTANAQLARACSSLYAVEVGPI